MQVGIDKAPGMLLSGQLDAFFWSGGLPTAAVAAMATPVARIKLVQLGDLVAKLHAMGPQMAYYRQAVMPADAYPTAQNGQAGQGHRKVHPGNGVRGVVDTRSGAGAATV